MVKRQEGLATEILRLELRKQKILVMALSISMIANLALMVVLFTK